MFVRLKKFMKLGGYYKVAYVGLTPILGCFTRSNLTGKENIPTGGFILVSNHLSTMDPLVQAYRFGVLGYEVRFMAKSELFRVPVLGRILTNWGMIPVHRKAGDARNSLEAAEEALSLDRIVSFFPEGTITKDPAFWPMTFKTGAARLALKTGATILPVTQWGTQDLLDRSSRLIRFRRSKLEMRILPPIDPRSFGESDQDKEAVSALTEELQQLVMANLGDIRQEEPPEKPWSLDRLQVPKPQWRTFSSWRRLLAKRTGRQDILPGTNR